MGKGRRAIPVYDYRQGHKGTEVAQETVERTPKVVRGKDGESVKVEGNPKVGQNGLHGGVLTVDRNGNQRIVYH